MADDRFGAPQFDTSVAHIARVQDYWLGGKDNFHADREAGDQAIRTASWPGCWLRCPPAAIW
jgi:hypothetical protein